MLTYKYVDVGKKNLFTCQRIHIQSSIRILLDRVDTKSNLSLCDV